MAGQAVPTSPAGEVDRFRGRAVRLPLFHTGLGAWRLSYPLRVRFGPLPGRPGEAPEPGDLPRVFAGRKASRGYAISTELLEPAAEAALWAMRLEERPCYLLRGDDVRPARDGAMRVRVEDVEGVPAGTPISMSGSAEAFFGDAVAEVRELYRSVEPLLSDSGLRDLERGMYAGGHLCQALQDVARAIADEDEDEIPDRRDDHPLYLRFGDPPPSGCSRDWTGGVEEAVSCFRARREEDGSYLVDASAFSGLLGMFKALVEEERPAYLATGEEIGTGGAREPLLDGVTLELEELPAGTRIRCSEEWQATVTLDRATQAMRGMVYPARDWRPPQEYVAPDLARSEPAGDLRQVLDAARSRPHASASELHGEDHWRRVAAIGARIAGETPGVDGNVVLLFALLHDAARVRDFYDEHHAFRGARLARRLLTGGEVLDADRLETLLYAIEHHNAGETSDDPAIGACWDADRLDLQRLGIRPNPELLSTAAAKGPETIAWARGLQGSCPAWPVRQLR